MNNHNNNYQIIKAQVNRTIDTIFEKNGKLEIPTVDSICSLTQTSRKIVIKYLYKWWLKNDYLEKNDHFLSSIPELIKADDGHKLINQLESVIKEVEVYNASLNFLPNVNYPFGNYMIQSLLEIQNKIDKLVLAFTEAKNLNQHLQNELISKDAECCRLNKEIEILRANSRKKLTQVKKELDKYRREAIASNQRVKSLKRKKRAFNIKHLFCY